MICSDCKKNTAVIFVNKENENGQVERTGYCYSCAKKRGISNLHDVNKLSEEDIVNMESQLSDMLKDISANFSIEDMNPENFDSAVDAGLADENGDGTGTPMGFAIPLGSIFSNMINGNSASNSNNKGSAQKKAVKTEKKSQGKKRKFLNTFGTNLTDKARNGRLDKVIGRDKEIARIVQILNRRTKNNPCLIGEPGVG